MEHIDKAGLHNWAYTCTLDLEKKKKKKIGLLRPNKSHNMESGVRAPDEI